jgi:gliding motility-associated-like protein
MAPNGYIYQYNISSNDSASITQSAVQLYWNQTINSSSHSSGALQIACDNKIYVAFKNYSYIGVINNPDSAGLSCNLVMNSVYLNGKICTYGLPTFFPGYFKPVPDFTYTQNCLNIVFKPNCDSAALDSIRWNFGDIASGINNTSALYNPVHKFSNTGNYTVKVIYYYPCNVSDTVLKTISVQLPAYIFPQSYITDTITNLCKQLRFTPVCDSAALDSLRWNFGDAASGSANTSGWFHPVHTFSDTGTYTVSLVLYAYCRTDTIFKTIQVKLPIPGVFLGADTTLCSGDVLQIGGIIPSQLPVSYLWQNGTAAPVFTVTQAGTYRLQVNAGGCLFSDTIIIGYLNPPAVSLPNDTVICEDSRVDVHIPQGMYTLLWDDGSTFFNRSFTQAGNYWLTATNICGNVTNHFNLETKNCNCYLYFPNAFSPEGNNLNDCFGAVYNCEFENWHLYIYNRWGQLLFETKNPAACWDGKYNSEAVESGVYVWILEYKSIYENATVGKKGMVTVVK